MLRCNIDERSSMLRNRVPRERVRGGWSADEPCFMRFFCFLSAPVETEIRDQEYCVHFAVLGIEECETDADMREVPEDTPLMPIIRRHLRHHSCVNGFETIRCSVERVSEAAPGPISGILRKFPAGLDFCIAIACIE